MQRMTKYSLLFFISTSISIPASALTGLDEREARLAIAQINKNIRYDIQLRPDELERLSDEFRKYYEKQVLPRLEDPAAFIDANAMHWVDIDWDKRPELLFWTEGITPSKWGLKEHLYILKMDNNDYVRIMKKEPLDPSPTRNNAKYRYRAFKGSPNEGTDYNAHLRAVFSYGNFGEFNIVYTNYEISWHIQQQKLKITKFKSAFPVLQQTQ